MIGWRLTGLIWALCAFISGVVARRVARVRGVL